jgi:hypothetical protein
MARKDNGYFAARESEEAVSAIQSKIDGWATTLRSNGYIDKLRNMYNAYHGAYFDTTGDAHQISFGGDDGEIVQIAVNHIRNIGEHMVTMMTSSRPSMECRAANTDYQSLIQTQLGNGLLDYYMREKRLEEYFVDACRLAVCLGSGWIKLSWNSTLGNVVNQEEIDLALESGEETPIKEYEGDLEYEVVSPLDIILDLSQEGRDHDWIICRSYKNRYDLIAKYPDLEDEIMAIESKSRIDGVGVSSSITDETDLIPVFEFYHKRTSAITNGRYIFFASSKAVFYDGDLPYRKIPIYPIYFSRFLGSPLGYTALFDVLPIQDAMNTLYTSALSNNVAFGTQNILVPNGSNVDMNQLGGSLNVITYNQQAGPPTPLNLTNTSPELYNFVNMLNNLAETISGINSVVRGNPEASLRSASAIAMIQSNAIQFMSSLQASYTYLIENVGMGTLEILQDFATSPRIANIVGESGKSYMKTFKGTDIIKINRVLIDSANPLTRTISGRVQMADNLLQYQLLKDPQQYLNIINNGKLEVGTEGTMKSFNLIRGENEGMMQGIPQRALILDDHARHISEHASLLADPIFRDPSAGQLQEIVLSHIQEHKDLWVNADPALLMATGQQPAPQPEPPQQPPQGEPSQGEPPQAESVPQDTNQMPPEEQAGAQVNKTRFPEGFDESNTPLSPEQNAELMGLRG